MAETQMTPEMEALERKIRDGFLRIRTGFEKIEKISNSSKQNRQICDITIKLRECKGQVKEFTFLMKEMEAGGTKETNRQLHEKKNQLIKELNEYVIKRKEYVSHFSEEERSELFNGGEREIKFEVMNNQELIVEGRKNMDATDKSIERSKKVLEDTISIGAQTAITLKGQTEQMERVVDDLDKMNVSISKSIKLAKQFGRQLATDKCIMLALLLVVLGVIAIIVSKIVKSSKSKKDGTSTTVRRLLNSNVQLYDMNVFDFLEMFLE